jgi:putative phage-type endonuclease
MSGRKVTPTGVLVARYDTPRAEWLRLRRDGIGGSDALAVLGLDPWKTRMEVYLDKTGDVRAEREQTDRMRWGQLAESAIAEWFAERTGIKVRRCGLLRHESRTWQRVSVDRLTADGGVLEIKNTNYHRRREWEDEEGEIVADGAEAQGQHALAVTGLPHVWVCAQVGGEPPVIRRIQRDEAFIRDLTEAEAEFWALVQARTPPALDGGAAATRLLDRMYPEAAPGKTAELDDRHASLLGEYLKEGTARKAAEDRQEEIKAQIQAVMGDAEIATYRGQPAARWANRSRTSVPKENIAILRERHPDVAAEVVTTKGFRQFGVTLKGAA